MILSEYIQSMIAKYPNDTWAWFRNYTQYRTWSGGSRGADVVPAATNVVAATAMFPNCRPNPGWYFLNAAIVTTMTTPTNSPWTLVIPHTPTSVTSGGVAQYYYQVGAGNGWHGRYTSGSFLFRAYSGGVSPTFSVMFTGPFVAGVTQFLFIRYLGSSWSVRMARNTWTGGSAYGAPAGYFLELGRYGVPASYGYYAGYMDEVVYDQGTAWSEAECDAFEAAALTLPQRRIVA